jgi:hypothetical protein
MPRPKKKDPKRWTVDDAMERLFPKKNRERAKEIAHDPEKPQVKRPDSSIEKKRT